MSTAIVVLLARTYTSLVPAKSRGKMEVLSSFLRTFARGTPGFFKYFVIALFLLNVRSWPIMWHFKVWRPVFSIRLRFMALRLRSLFLSKEAKLEVRQKWLEKLSPVGSNPFEKVTTYRTWAGLDDCDFNLHLSNSCYAKNADMARFKTALAFFPTFFRCGGWMALGATHYKFIREVPMLSTYEMRISMACWDRKWIYILVRYVTHPKNKNKKKSSPQSTPPSETPSPPSFVDAPPVAHIHTPATSHSVPSGSASEPLKHLVTTELQQAEEDGATLHCIAISELCFKIGRITVPPALVLACEGFSVPPSPTSLTGSEDVKPYSHENPPPHWEFVRNIRSDHSLKGMQELFKGGWKDIPEEERWWDKAMGGVVEEKRRVNLELLEGVQKGMEGARVAY